MKSADIASYNYDHSMDDYKSFDINGEEYRVKRFDAFTGMSVAKTVWKHTLGKELPKDITLENMFMVMAMQFMTNAELETVGKQAVKVCEKHLKAGWTAIVDKSGNYKIPELETDSAAIIVIMREAVLFGTSDFFTAMNSILK